MRWWLVGLTFYALAVAWAVAFSGSMAALTAVPIAGSGGFLAAYLWDKGQS